MNDRLFLNTHLTYNQYQFDVDQDREDRTGGPGQTDQCPGHGNSYAARRVDGQLRTGPDRFIFATK